MMRNNKLLFFLLALLIADTIYSYYQYLHVSLDGDLAAIVMPGEWYRKVIEDPFGISVLLNKETYAATNRFFAHWSMMKYFKNVPIWIQSFSSPIDSIYIACAIAKILAQLCLTFLIASYINPNARFFSKEFLIAAILIIPLFQAAGYYDSMGVIDMSITYVFFYAIAICWLLLFFFPFYKAFYNEQEVKLNALWIIALLVLTFVMAFNGPLDSSVPLLLCPMVLLYLFFQQFKKQPTEKSFIARTLTAVGNISRPVLFFFLFLTAICLYSFYIGKYNAENFGAEQISLWKRYQRLPKGLFLIFFQKSGLWMLTLAIGINTFLIYKLKENAEAKKIAFLLKWILVFSLVYTLLLPLGGYREYRYYIIRRDSYLPVLLCIFFLYGYSSYILLNYLNGKYKKFYVAGIAILVLIFTINDKPILDHNACEKRALEKIAASPDKVVVLDYECNVMCWIQAYDASYTDAQGSLLQLWGVTKEKKQYYQK